MGEFKKDKMDILAKSLKEYKKICKKFLKYAKKQKDKEVKNAIELEQYRMSLILDNISIRLMIGDDVFDIENMVIMEILKMNEIINMLRKNNCNIKINDMEYQRTVVNLVSNEARNRINSDELNDNDKLKKHLNYLDNEIDNIDKILLR